MKLVSSKVILSKLLPWIFMWSSKFPKYMGDFECSSSPRKLSPQLFLPGIRQSVICLNHNLLLQAALGCEPPSWFQVKPVAFKISRSSHIDSEQTYTRIRECSLLCSLQTWREESHTGNCGMQISWLWPSWGGCGCNHHKAFPQFLSCLLFVN